MYSLGWLYENGQGVTKDYGKARWSYKGCRGRRHECQASALALAPKVAMPLLKDIVCFRRNISAELFDRRQCLTDNRPLKTFFSLRYT